MLLLFECLDNYLIGRFSMCIEVLVNNLVQFFYPFCLYLISYIFLLHDIKSEISYIKSLLG